MAGKEGKSVGKVGRPSAEDKQRKLTLEGKEGKEGKKVKFRLSEESMEKEEKRKIVEVCKDIIEIELRTLVEERKKEEGALRELKERIKEHEERLDKVERKLDEIGKWLKKWEDEEQREEKENSSKGSARGAGYMEREREGSSARSEGGISVGSSLSTREVDRIRRWVTEKDREERRKNIVLKGIRLPKEVEKDRKRETEWVERLIREKVEVDVNVVGCRESGTVLVVKLESEEEKREVMRNKHRLKGEKIYIENDLSWEERNTQIKINKWAKEQKGRGLEVKIGVGRVRVRGVWRAWAEIEREGVGRDREEDKRGKKRERGVEGDRKNRIFKSKPRREKKGTEEKEGGWERKRR